MPTQLRLLPYQLADLEVIRDIGEAKLRAVIERLQNIQTVPRRAKDLHKEIAAALEDKSEVAGRILGPLLSLRAIIRQRRLSADEVIEGLRYGIETSDSEWTPEEMDRWSSVEPLIKDLLFVRAVRLVATALDLSYEYQNVLQGARIVTDIRPVFNEEGDGIEVAVVSQTLRLRYDTTEGDHSLSIAMDENDVRDLERQCQRALKKARTARDLMTKQASIPTTISGEGSHEQD